MHPGLGLGNVFGTLRRVLYILEHVGERAVGMTALTENNMDRMRKFSWGTPTNYLSLTRK